MIFAFATDEKTLTIFPDEKAAVAFCEGLDVAEGDWLFFATDGSPMDPVFSLPATRKGVVVSHGRYSLCLSQSRLKSHLLALLSQVSSVEGAPPLNSVAAIEKLLSPCPP